MPNFCRKLFLTHQSVCNYLLDRSCLFLAYVKDEIHRITGIFSLPPRRLKSPAHSKFKQKRESEREKGVVPNPTQPNLRTQPHLFPPIHTDFFVFYDLVSSQARLLRYVSCDHLCAGYVCGYGCTSSCLSFTHANCDACCS
jgi:hypothetical protein